MMEAATAKETDTQKAKVFLTSAFGIRFAWLPSPNSILWFSSSRREFLDIPQPSLVLSEGLFLMAEPKENYWTTTTTTTTEMTKTHNGSAPRNFYSKYSHTQILMELQGHLAP